MMSLRVGSVQLRRTAISLPLLAARTLTHLVSGAGHIGLVIICGSKSTTVCLWNVGPYRVQKGSSAFIGIFPWTLIALMVAALALTIPSTNANNIVNTIVFLLTSVPSSLLPDLRFSPRATNFRRCGGFYNPPHFRINTPQN